MLEDKTTLIIVVGPIAINRRIGLHVHEVV
ncbi:MAG: hypothetical protein JWM78_1211 [Verrucomicrobiaceae bacterium]|nr:hypothetical protein [Verrucomicrobiaceae bacterium]